MGIGFVIALHLVLLGTLSLLIAFVSITLTYFFGGKSKRKRKLFLAGLIPFQFLFSLYILGLTGMGVVSSIKNVDIGIGDSFYVPLSNTCKILMIDSPTEATLLLDDEPKFSSITKITVTEEWVVGSTSKGEYFGLNLQTGDVKSFESSLHLLNHFQLENAKLFEVEEFYSKRKQEVAGSLSIMIGILSLLFASGLAFSTIWLSLKNWGLTTEITRT